MSGRDVHKLTICAVGPGSSTHIAARVRWFAERGHRVFLLTTSPSPSGIPGVTEVDLNAEPLVRAEALLLGMARRVRSGLPRHVQTSRGGSAAGRPTTSPELETRGEPARKPVRAGLHRALSSLDFLRALRRCEPDVVHVHYAYGHPSWLPGLFGCRPLVVTVMGGDVLFEEQGSPTAAGKWLTVRLLQQADYITTQSHLLTATVERLGDFAGKTERVLWGVSLDKFRPQDGSAVRLALGLNPETRIVLSAKILQPFYRVHLVVEAMAVVRESCPDAVLVITEYLADPAYREQILRRVDELGLGRQVVMSGVFTDDDMPALYSTSTVSIAVPPSDGMPQALLESMACETPQILSRLSRYEELVQHEQSAYFVEPNPESIAAGIVRLLEDETLRSRIAREGRRVVAEQANVDEQAGHVESRLLELTATTPPRTFSLAALLSSAAAYASFHRSA